MKSKREQAYIDDLKWKNRDAEGRAAYFSEQAERARTEVANVTGRFQTEIKRLESLLSERSLQKSSEDARFNGVLQASIQTAIATAKR